VAVTVEILPAAQRQLDAADERWVDEHGLFADNPLFEQISHARTLLADNPQLGKIARRGRTTIYKLVFVVGLEGLLPLLRRPQARRDRRHLVRRSWRRAAALSAGIA
jgi:hypothetical protein